jgi:hypothetical protein
LRSERHKAQAELSIKFRAVRQATFGVKEFVDDRDVSEFCRRQWPSARHDL